VFVLLIGLSFHLLNELVIVTNGFFSFLNINFHFLYRPLNSYIPILGFIPTQSVCSSPSYVDLILCGRYTQYGGETDVNPLFIFHFCITLISLRCSTCGYPQILTLCRKRCLRRTFFMRTCGRSSKWCRTRCTRIVPAPAIIGPTRSSSSVVIKRA